MNITTEILAAYVEGNVSQEEREAVRLYLSANPEALQSVMFAMEDDIVDRGNRLQQSDFNTYQQNLCNMIEDIDTKSSSSPKTFDNSILPLQARAAQNAIDNQCAIKCEGYAIRYFGIDVSDEELIEESNKEGWLQTNGTALHNIGKIAGTRGLSVSHRYQCTEKDIREALTTKNVLIAAVDSNELLGDYSAEQKKDIEIGVSPNHVVVIIDIDDNNITIIDSATPLAHETYPISQFIDAWADSSYYLITISNSDEYIPHPINLDDIDLEEDLLELREAIAENAHEIWAEARRKEGWSYGEIRDDEKRLHPDMLPYNRLPESEKEYDRNMAINTIKLVKKLGWIIKKDF